LTALRDRAAGEQQAGAEEQVAGRSATLEALADVRQAEAPARFSEDDAERLAKLRAFGLIAEREYARGEAEALKLRAAADTKQAAVRRIEDEQRMRQSDRAARLMSLTAEIKRIEAEMPTIQASIARLEYEIERRMIRATISGKLGEAAVLRTGAVVRE